MDFLLEKKLANAGVVTVEAEYAKYDGLGGYPTPGGWRLREATATTCSAPTCSRRWSGIGKFQVLGKYGEATYDFVGGDIEQDTLELDLNYIIKQFNARVSLFYIDKDFDPDVGGDSRRSASACRFRCKQGDKQ